MEPGTSTDGPHLPYIDLKTAIGQGLHPKRLYIETEAFDIERHPARSRTSAGDHAGLGSAPV